MKKTALLFTLCVAVLSCVNTPKEIGTTTIDINQNEVLDELFDTCTFVSLESTPESLISYINKVEIQKDTLFVFDESLNTVFLFDINGTYLNKIAKVGRGPGEYLSAQDFDTYHSTIFVLDRINKKILTYTPAGQFIRDYELNDRYNSLSVVDDTQLYLYSENSNNQWHNFILYNYAHDTYPQKFDEFKQNESYGFGSSPFHRASGNKLFTTEQFDANIYELTPNSKERRYHFSFNTEEHIETNDWSLPKQELSAKYRHKLILRKILGVDRLDNKLVMLYEITLQGKGGVAHITTIDDKSGKITTGQLRDCAEAFPYACFRPIGLRNGSLISTATSAESLMNFDKTLPQPSLLKQANLTMGNNPVLIFHKLKQ